jgi:hypothetical protein
VPTGAKPSPLPLPKPGGAAAGGGTPLARISVIPKSALAAMKPGAVGGGFVVPSPGKPREGAVERAPRHAKPIDVRLPAVGDRPAVNAVSRDVSTTGLSIVTGTGLEVGATIELELLLPSQGGLGVEPIKAAAKVVRKAGGLGYGLEFVEPSAALIASIKALPGG